MKKQITEAQQKKLKKLNDELCELWECLTPSEKSRKSIFTKFHELQVQIKNSQKRKQTTTKEDKNDQSS